jgi:hypothetical protein
MQNSLEAYRQLAVGIAWVLNEDISYFELRNGPYTDILPNHMI